MMTRRRVLLLCPGCSTQIFAREYYGIEGGIYLDHSCPTPEQRIKLCDKGLDIAIFEGCEVWPKDEKKHRAYALQVGPLRSNGEPEY